MARNLYSTTISGNYTDGTDLLPIIKTEVASDLASIGVTGAGLPNIYVTGIDGTSDASLSVKLSDISKIAALPKISSTYLFELGVYTDNISVPIDRLTVVTDTPSGNANIRVNAYYDYR